MTPIPNTAAPNLVTLIAGFITPMIANRIAGALGVNSALVTTAISAILPALLAGLASKASTPAGASALLDLLGKQDPNALGALADQIGGANQTSLIDSGTSALTSLLGGSSLGALTSGLSQFAGTTPAQSGSLIGMMAPVVLGQLAGQVASSGLDAGGLATRLADQKQNIAAAMPAGFAAMLGGSGLLDGIKDTMPEPVVAAAPVVAPVAVPSAPVAAPTPAPVPAPAPTPVRSPVSPSIPPATSATAEVRRIPTPIPTTPTGRPAPTGSSWIPYAAGAAILMTLFYVFGGNGSVPQPSAPAAQSTAITPAAEASESARKILAGLATTLGTVKDQATAQAALPKLTETAVAIDGLTKLTGTLSSDAKSTLAKLIGSQLPTLMPLVASVLKAPGAEALLKPVLDQIVSKLTALSK